MSLEEMASQMEELFGVPMSPSQLSKIETQKKRLLDLQLMAAASVLDVEIADLFPGRGRADGQKG